jgi:VIT1/CCC1 family predicted Fe2+/Mn2+ transporter
MRSVLWKGFGFGVTSGVITTLGVVSGLHAGTHSKLAVLAGIVVLAISDALSDAMGIHVSEEAEMEHTSKELWEASFFTFISKLIFTLTFIFPIAFLELYVAIMVSIFWGLFLITLFSFYMAKSQKQKPYKVIIEHVFITVLVVLLTHYIGDIIYEITNP